MELECKLILHFEAEFFFCVRVCAYCIRFFPTPTGKQSGGKLKDVPDESSSHRYSRENFDGEISYESNGTNSQLGDRQFESRMRKLGRPHQFRKEDMPMFDASHRVGG